MKKSILIIGLVVVALAVVGVSAAFAQGPAPDAGTTGLPTGAGFLHTYMVAAFAEKLNLKLEDVNARLAAGESMYEIAIATGVQAQDFSALMVEVRSQALHAALKDGVITQAQADWMLSRGFGRGYGPGNCPMINGQGALPNRGAGMMNRNGRSMMGGGFGWQNQQAKP